nr:MAG TPA: YvrJ protein family protein [Caudoviricetes sp.]
MLGANILATAGAPVGDVITAISTVGFPIVMCLVIMYYWNNQYSKTISELKGTISRLTDVVADNTKALALLEQRLGKDDEDGGR